MGIRIIRYDGRAYDPFDHRRDSMGKTWDVQLITGMIKQVVYQLDLQGEHSTTFALSDRRTTMRDGLHFAGSGGLLSFTTGRSQCPENPAGAAADHICGKMPPQNTARVMVSHPSIPWQNFRNKVPLSCPPRL